MTPDRNTVRHSYFFPATFFLPATFFPPDAFPAGRFADPALLRRAAVAFALAGFALAAFTLPGLAWSCLPPARRTGSVQS